MLFNVTLDYDMLSCNETSCNILDNKLSIDQMYLCIIKAMCDSGHSLIPVVGTKSKFQPIVGVE